MVGGDLHWIWAPYGLYQEIDYVRRIVFDRSGGDANHNPNSWLGWIQIYGVKALQENNGFTNAQCKFSLFSY
jgi:hypothetical protein